MGGNSTSTSTTTIPPEILRAYQGVANSAESFYGNVKPQNYSNDPNSFVAPLNATQYAGIGNVNSAVGQAQPYYQFATNQLQQAQGAAQPYYSAAGQNYAYGQGAGQAYTDAATTTLGLAGAGAGAYNNAANANMGTAYSNAQPYTAAATQDLANGQAVGSGLAGASLGTLSNAQRQGQAYTNAAYGSAQPYNDAAGQAFSGSYGSAQPYNAAAGQSYAAGLGAAQPYNNAAGQSYAAAEQQAQPYNNAAGQAYATGLGAAQPYNNAATGQFYAGQANADPLQQQAAQGIGQAYGQAQPYNGAATGLAAAGAGQVNAQQIGGDQIGQFMSPYIQSVLQGTQGMLNQQNQQAMSGQMGNAIQSGAFGGDRAGIAAANLAQQQRLADAQTYSGILNQGYGQALSAAQQQQGVSLSAGQANRAAVQNASNQMLGIGNQQFNQGLGAAQQQAALGQQVFGQGQAMGQNLGNIGQQVFGQSQTAGQNMGALGQQVFGQHQATGQNVGALGQQIFGQNQSTGQNIGALGQQVFGQGQTAGQNLGNLGQQKYAQGTGTGAQLYSQGLGAAQQQAAVGAQQFGQGATASQQNAALGQQQYSQGMGLAAGQQGLGQQVYAQGANTAQQQAALGQQAYAQAQGTGQAVQGLGKDIYGTGAQTAQQMAALGQGAQGASLQGAQAQMAAGQTQQQTQQAALQAMYNQWYQTNYGLPMSLLNTYAGAIEGIGQNAGSSTTTTQPGGLFGLATGGAVRPRKAGGGGLDGGYDPSLWGQTLAAQKASFPSDGGLAGPVAPPNFAGMGFNPTSPGAHAGPQAADHPGTAPNRPSPVAQATQNNLTDGLQKGEQMAGQYMLGKTGLGMLGHGGGYAGASSSLPMITGGMDTSVGGVGAGATAAMPAATLDTAGLSAALPAATAAAPAAGLAGAAGAAGAGLAGAAGAGAATAGAATAGAAAGSAAFADMLPLLLLARGGRAQKAGGGLLAGTQDPLLLQLGQAAATNIAQKAGHWMGGLSPDEQKQYGVGPQAASDAFKANTSGLENAVRQNVGETPLTQSNGATGNWTPPAAPPPAPRVPPHMVSRDINVRPTMATGPVTAPDPNAVETHSPAYGAPSGANSDPMAAALAAASQAQASAATAHAKTGDAPAAQQAADQAKNISNAVKPGSSDFAQYGKSVTGGDTAAIPAGAPAGGLAPSPAPAAPSPVPAAAAHPSMMGQAQSGLGAVGNAIGGFGGDLVAGVGNGLKGYGHQLREGDPNAWVPLLKGIGAMGAARTRNFGTALTQGLAAGAEAYYPTQIQQGAAQQGQATAQHQRLANLQDMRKQFGEAYTFVQDDQNGTIPGGDNHLYRAVKIDTHLGSAQHGAAPAGPAAAPGTPPSASSAPPQGSAGAYDLGDDEKPMAEQSYLHWKNAGENDPATAAIDASNKKDMNTRYLANRDDKPVNNSLINAVVGTPDDKNGKQSGINALVSQGPLSQIFTPKISAINQTMRAMGIPPEYQLSVNDIANGTVMDKIAKIRGTAAASSVEDLANRLSSMPSSQLPKKTNIKILAQQLVTSQQPLDQYGVAQSFGTNNGMEMTPNGYLSSDAQKVYAKHFGADRYAHEQAALETFFNDPGASKILAGLRSASPENQKWARGYFDDHYPGFHLDRYLIGDK